MCQGGDINFNFSTICVKKIDQSLTTKNAKKFSNKEIQSPSAIEPARDDSVLLQFGGSREDIIKFQTKFDSLKKVCFHDYKIVSVKNISLKNNLLKPQNSQIRVRDTSIRVHEDLNRLIFYCQTKSFDEESMKIIFKTWLH